jgi:hypothetical protein
LAGHHFHIGDQDHRHPCPRFCSPIPLPRPSLTLLIYVALTARFHDRRAPITSTTIKPDDPQLSPIIPKTIPGTIAINDVG